MTTIAEVGETLAELIKSELDGCNPLSQRIIANRVRSAIEPWIPQSPNTRPQEIVPFSDQEARAFERSSIPFGMHHGKPIADVPLEYLQWLADQSRQTWLNLHRYLNADRIRSEASVVDEGVE